MKTQFTAVERKFLLGIGAAMGLRQLALIIVMPLLAIYGNELKYSTPALVGLSLGIYGLFQAIFQIPYGSLSDRYGRKIIMLIGFLQFIMGLFMAGYAANIYYLIFARALQGSGAIMAVSYAWIADTVNHDRLNKAMSTVGMILGIAAVGGFMGGTILNNFLSISSLFVLCGVLSIFTWFYIMLLVKEEKKQIIKKEKLPFIQVVKNKNIIILSSLGFLASYTMVSIFFIVPQVAVTAIGSQNLWKIFVPSTLAGIVVMRFSARFADRGQVKKVFFCSLGGFIISALPLFFNNIILIALGMAVYMMAYMSMVTVVPASITKLAPAGYTGAVTGILNTVQFIGSFLGGTLTGVLWGISFTLPPLILVVFGIAGLVLVERLNKSDLSYICSHLS